MLLLIVALEMNILTFFRFIFSAIFHRATVIAGLSLVANFPRLLTGLNQPWLPSFTGIPTKMNTKFSTTRLNLLGQSMLPLLRQVLPPILNSTRDTVLTPLMVNDLVLPGFVYLS